MYAINEDLAYLCGLISGDGCLYRGIGNKKYYELSILGNDKNEREFYDDFIVPLFNKVFDVNIKARTFSKNTYGIRIYSKQIFTFLIDNIGFRDGKKAAYVNIPKIFKSDLNLKIGFIRGFADADFSLCLKKRYKNFPYYPVISGTSKSKQIILEIAELLSAFEISYSLSLDRVEIDKRFSAPVIKSSIDIYGKRNLLLWMDKIGFLNPKYLRTFQTWKEIDKQRNGAWRVEISSGGRI